MPAGASIASRLTSLAQRLVRTALPVSARDEIAESHAPADAEGAALLPVTFADDDRDVDAGHRPDVGNPMAVGPEDVDHLPACRGSCGDLPDLRILASQIGIDLRQQPDLLLEARLPDRVLVTVILLVGAVRSRRVGAGIPGRDGAHRIRRPFERSGGEFAGMGITHRFTGDGAKAEALIRIEASALEPAVVERERFCLRMLDEQFPVVGAGEGLGQNPLQACLVAIEQVQKVGIHERLLGSRRRKRLAPM